MTDGAHVEGVQCSEQTLRVSVAEDAHSIRLSFYKVLFTSKVLKIIYLHPIDRTKATRGSSISSGSSVIVW
jgi:hypothetical protein